MEVNHTLKSNYNYHTFNSSVCGKTKIYSEQSASNCKLAYIDYLGSLVNFTDEEKKITIGRLKQDNHGRNLYIHVIDKRVFDYLKDNYEHYYAVEIPCGYGTGFQYHILLKNRIDDREPIKYVKESEVDKSKFTYDKIVEIVNSVFNKVKSRKSRIELIAKELLL